jgi:peptidyl-prolyl cis-trans isomerase A (cyclophilin A)
MRTFVGAILGLSLCSALWLPPPARAATRVTQVKIVTGSGTVVVALDAKRAPKTVANFLHYVDAGFYNGGSFFRAIPGFVIQGGNKSRERHTDPKLELEPPITTGLRNVDGAISMARTADPNSATSEFFICDGNQPTLDGSMTAPGYAAFGHVVRGMDVVRKIARLPADAQMLATPVRIVKIVRAKGTPKRR